MHPFKDDNCIVLDFLPRGRAIGKPEPLAYVLGDTYFSLLEVVIKKDMIVKQGDRLGIGKNNRKEVDYIKRRITENELTNVAKNALEDTVKNIVKRDEKRFVNFFNKAMPLSTRLHQLELLPGIAKKNMWHIINERDTNGPFKSFEDIKKRIPTLTDPEDMITRRILEEIKSDKERYYLFVSKPREEEM